jgi:guanosine-3',5'-bis(diphosphate) 3'-pyrophosphohydrolase
MIPADRAALGTILKALAFAAERHRNQRRKDRQASPYINHPIALAEVLVNVGGVTDATVLSAALLHDAVEDTETTLEEIRAEFGARVAAIVDEVTDDKALGKLERKRLQIERSHALSREAKLVKLADKICNLRDLHASPPEGWSLERKREYFDWAGDVINGLRGANAALEAEFDAAHLKKP